MFPNFHLGKFTWLGYLIQLFLKLWNNLLYVVLHGRWILFHHSIYPHLFLRCLLKNWRLGIYQFTHKIHIDGKYLRWSSLSNKCPLSIHLLLIFSQCALIPFFHPTRRLILCEWSIVMSPPLLHHGSFH